MSETVTVVGAGTMGAGIAEVSAKAGYTVKLFDLDGGTLERARARIEKSLGKAVERGKLDASARDETLGRIAFVPEVASAVGAAWVIEAVPEDLRLKQKILGTLADENPDCILGSNTSSLSLTAIAGACAHPERVVGMHFFNPPPVMRFLEIVRAESTTDAVCERTQRFADSIDHTAIVVRDVAGFATSRLGLVIGLEAMRMLEEGVASAKDIDLAMSKGYRHPMGPLELTDLVGLDVRLAIAEHLTRELGERFEPPNILREKVAAGKLGKKTGEGFYEW
ncbi:MAG: 3-hydroxyacyl-CoA dehydrogenase family protein [Myxococcota bacterium]